MKKIINKVLYTRRQDREKSMMNRILNEVDFNIVDNVKPKNIKSITFVIPFMTAYSGGHTSILRLGTQLEINGYKVFYISYLPQDIEEMKKNAKINLENYRGTFLETQELYKLESDIVVATYWESVYYVKKMNGYKMYFIQDFEPFFNTYGELYILSKKTYELGLHMISLGEWNKHMIENQCEINSRIDTITFPYESKEYYPKHRNFKEYNSKKEFTIAVFLKDTGKRAPYLIQNILQNLKKILSEDGILLNIKYFGENKDFKCSGGENLGKLSKSDMLNLYHEADFGMVASLTNISLVPYEMIATNLPVIEFKEGTFKYFFPDKTAIITDFNYETLYNEFKYLINNPIELENLVKNSSEFIGKLSWTNTVSEFISILDDSVVDKENKNE